MAKYSKIGYGNYSDIDSAIAKGLLDGKDLVITKDTSELVYITNDKTKQVLQTRLKRFESEDAALAELISSPDTYDGQPVAIRNDTGCYQLYLVLTDDNGEFIVSPVFDASGTHVACDNKSLVTNSNGIMSIAGIEEAAVGSLLTKQADGSVEWVEKEIGTTSPLFINIQKFYNRPQANFAYAIDAADFNRVASEDEKAIVIVTNHESSDEHWVYICDGTVNAVFGDRSDPENYAVTFKSVVNISNGASASTDISLGLTNATSGKIAKIKTVDENGAPTEWEAVDMPTGIVQSSTEENKIKINEDNTMEVNSLNVNKIVQDEKEDLIVFGGNA